MYHKNIKILSESKLKLKHRGSPASKLKKHSLKEVIIRNIVPWSVCGRDRDWPIAIYWGRPPTTPPNRVFLHGVDLFVVPQIVCNSEDLLARVTFVAWASKSRNIANILFLPSDWSSSFSPWRTFMRFLRLVCMSEDLLTLVAFVAWAEWEQQYWPIGGSPSRGIT